MAAPFLTLTDISLTFGGPPLLQGAELMVHEGDRICLVGRNGSGKSTLLKVAADLIQSDGGARGFAPEAIVAIGDNQNDISMFEAVGLSIAMGNAADTVKAAATRVTGDNVSDGVAQAIERLLA